jgi:hypothetical protein
MGAFPPELFGFSGNPGECIAAVEPGPRSGEIVLRPGFSSDVRRRLALAVRLSTLDVGQLPLELYFSAAAFLAFVVNVAELVPEDFNVRKYHDHFFSFTVQASLGVSFHDRPPSSS